MKTSVLLTGWLLRDEKAPIQLGLKLILITLFSIYFTSCFAQQKTVNQQELQQKLTEVNDKIQVIDETIAIINARIVGVPPENIDPSVQVRLNDLQIRKDQYTREKISIEALLNTSQNSNVPENWIWKSRFLSIPNQNQTILLANSEPDTVIENI